LKIQEDDTCMAYEEIKEADRLSILPFLDFLPVLLREGCSWS